ncbi:ABC transporter permease subunit [Streptomyces smaragdinus]|uniref:ABC transporter permease subunit n=1 Tax=Streptomyces smaragdinus TaxID=2585196 RepID=UPI0012962310|nr:ABC transporter permease subunit [Streptomyces smaragdinus]
MPPGRDGFLQLLRAELTKFRSVRRWLIGLAAAALVSVTLTMLASNSGPGNNQAPDALAGPGGGAVQDRFRFVHQPLTGDGEIVARVVSMADGSGGSGERESTVPGDEDHGIVAWAKAGVLIKDGTKQGSRYAALMVTPGHGVRLQHNYTEDLAGSDAAPKNRWLKLVRKGTGFTGYESADGSDWTKVGTVTVAGLPRTAEVGLFVASSDRYTVERSFGTLSEGVGPSKATGVFDHVTLNGAASDAWTGEPIGELSLPKVPDRPDDRPLDEQENREELPPRQEIEDLKGSDRESGGVFTVTGSGDIAPDAFVGGDNLTQGLAGSWVALMVFAALGTLFITSEYRRGMIRTTLTATPRRGRVLVAKALVIGAVSFAVALPATALGFAWAQQRMQDHGYVPPVYLEYSLAHGTGLRAVIGTSAMLALVAVLALAAGAVLRHSAGAITGVILLMLAPLILGGALPLGATQWLFRLTPVAAFSVQRSGMYYPQMERPCMPENACYPLAPAGGLGVLLLWAAALLALAVWRLRKSDV